MPETYESIVIGKKYRVINRQGGYHNWPIGEIVTAFKKRDKYEMGEIVCKSPSNFNYDTQQLAAYCLEAIDKFPLMLRLDKAEGVAILELLKEVKKMTKTSIFDNIIKELEE